MQPGMDSHDSSPFPARDWFFPSPPPSFSPRQPRRFSTNPHAPSRSFLSHRYAPPCAALLSSPSYSEVKYAGFRQRTSFTRRLEQSNEHEVEVKDDVEEGVKKSEGDGEEKGEWVRSWWLVAFLVAVVIMTVSSLLHNNISLRNQASC